MLQASVALVEHQRISVWLRPTAAAQSQCKPQKAAAQLAHQFGRGAAQCMVEPHAVPIPVRAPLPSAVTAEVTGRLAAEQVAARRLAGMPVGVPHLAGPGYFQWKADLFHLALLGGALDAGPICPCPKHPSPSVLSQPQVPRLAALPVQPGNRCPPVCFLCGLS